MDQNAHFTEESRLLCKYGVVTFLYEDLARHGVVLVPLSAQDYDSRIGRPGA
jgi:hypothetical protein